MTLGRNGLNDFLVKHRLTKYRALRKCCMLEKYVTAILMSKYWQAHA